MFGINVNGDPRSLWTSSVNLENKLEDDLADFVAAEVIGLSGIIAVSPSGKHLKCILDQDKNLWASKPDDRTVFCHVNNQEDYTLTESLATLKLLAPGFLSFLENFQNLGEE